MRLDGVLKEFYGTKMRPWKTQQTDVLSRPATDNLIVDIKDVQECPEGCRLATVAFYTCFVSGPHDTILPNRAALPTASS